MKIGCVADVDAELAESNEGTNRLTRTLNVPSSSPTRAQPVARPMVFGSVTPRQGAIR